MLPVMKAHVAETCRRKNNFVVDQNLFVVCLFLCGAGFSYISDTSFNLLKPKTYLMYRQL